MWSFSLFLFKHLEEENKEYTRIEEAMRGDRYLIQAAEDGNLENN